MKRYILCGDTFVHEHRQHQIYDTGSGYIARKDGKQVVSEMVDIDEVCKQIDELLDTPTQPQVHRVSKPAASRTRVLQSCQYGRIKSGKVTPPTTRCYVLCLSSANLYKGANSRLVPFRDGRMMVYFNQEAARKSAHYSSADYVVQSFLLS